MRLKDCDNCLVYGSDKRPLAKARVEDAGDDAVQLFFYRSQLRNARLKTLVDFYDGQRGMVRCLCELVIKKNQAHNSLNEPWMADGTILKVYDIIQRQKDLRVDVHASLEFRTAEGVYFTGVMQNLSAGGLLISTVQPLDQDQVFSFRCTFDGEPRSVAAKVVRRQPLNAQGSFGYGCQFVDLPSDAEADIRKFVYKKQIENRLKKKEKMRR